MERRIELEGCRCPGAPHRDDWVEVVERVSVSLGAALLASGRNAEGSEIAAEAYMAESALRFGIARWSFTDTEGLPVAIEWAEINRLLPFNDAYTVADRVIGLHFDEVFRPLLSRTSTRSPGGRTDGSTSPTRATGKRPRRPSGPSSPTPTDGTPSEVPVP